MKEFFIGNDSETLSATLFDNNSNQVTVLIIASATGVKQEFYYKFGKYSEDNGITVITF